MRDTVVLNPDDIGVPDDLRTVGHVAGINVLHIRQERFDRAEERIMPAEHHCTFLRLVRVVDLTICLLQPFRSVGLLIEHKLPEIREFSVFYPQGFQLALILGFLIFSCTRDFGQCLFEILDLLFCGASAAWVGNR